MQVCVHVCVLRVRGWGGGLRRRGGMRESGEVESEGRISERARQAGG